MPVSPVHESPARRRTPLPEAAADRRPAWGDSLPVDSMGSWTMRLVDVRDLAPQAAGEELLQLDLADFPGVRRAMAGVDVVVHLAAIPGEDSFSRLGEAEVFGTYQLFEASRQAR